MKLIYAFLFLVAAAQLKGAPLSLEGCKRIALDLNPMARAACEGVRIAEADVGIARSPYYPHIGAEASYSRWQKHDFITLNDPTGTLPTGILPSIIGPTNDYNFSISSHYLLFDWGERRSQLMAALAEQGAACEEVEKIRQEILLNVSLAFYHLIANIELAAVAKENLTRAENHLRLAKERHDVGDAPLSDVYRAQVEASQAQLELVRAENLVRVSSTQLNSAMGLTPQVELEVYSDEKGTPDLSTAGTVQDAQERAVASRPELLTLQQQLCALRYKVEEAKSAFGPKVIAEGGYGKRDSDWFPSDDEWLVGVSVQIPLFTGYELASKLRRAKAELSRLRAQYERASLDIQQQVWVSYSRLREAFEKIQTSLTQVADAKESMRLTEERYRAGVSTINDLLDAQTALARALATQVEAFWSYKAATAAFHWTQGESLLASNSL